MKRIISSVILAAAVLATSGSGQTTDNKDGEKLLALVADVQAQQASMADNQSKIDSKMTEVIEAIRVARIFAGRGGK